MSTIESGDIARARATNADCPICLGAGVLPSMLCEGMTDPCPRCTHALKPKPACGRCKATGIIVGGDGVRRLCPLCSWSGASFHVEKTEPVEAGGCAPPILSGRRSDDRSQADTQRAVWLGVVIGAGGASAVWLVIGIFARFGG